ncbi:Maleylacetate protein [Lasiodiplodia theobromae]|uniref:Maleylacetate protein n=1 Tax=Lasiodiplodia theobromae TaxID=45133 RepID=UPI0015C3655B|nr:Maleylacetate protein [Lasiodiplodia theobromae]KAF4534919.1 Maleylacetate protein [Lasiodiplodia theobromae]
MTTTTTTTMQPFEYNANPARVIFGPGTLKQLPAELARLRVSAPLLLSTPQQLSQAQSLQSLILAASSSSESDKPITPAGIFAEATMHTPTSVTERALDVVRQSRADAVVSVGGGSTIGLGKALAVRTGLPHVCVPTTYAGSEMTPILGETSEEGEGGKKAKTTRSDPKILPGTVIYDVELTMTLPAGLSATSGVNAIAHAVEALYARNTNPIITLLALEGTKALATSLPTIIQNPSDTAARTAAQYGAWLCGTCLGSVGMALHHKLCHALGGTLDLPHAETHTIVLPHALAYNAPALPEETLKRLADALPGSEGDPVRGLNVLLGRLGVKRALRDLGMEESGIDVVADVAVRNPYWNPRPVEREGVREVIRRAWAGEEARAV